MRSLCRSVLPTLLLLLAGLAGCSDHQPTGGPNDVGTRQITLAGRVVDETGAGVSGATVTAHGASTTTDADGLFTFAGVTVPTDRGFVTAKSTGKFTATRGFIPGDRGTTVRLTLTARPLAGTVNATSGGTVTVGNGASVRIPANGIAREDGTPYSGTVRVMARAWQPGDNDFNACFPGDARARGTDGSAALLVSLGFQNIELEDASGQPLQLKSGAKATLTYAVPPSMQMAAPDRIPLWYFDHAQGLWIEEGEAVRQGAVYTGDVAHFTPWNIDWKGGFGRVCGRVGMCGEEDAGGVVVNVGPVQTVTDADGNFCVEVAAGWPQPYDVYATPYGNGGITSNHVSVTTVNPGQTVTVDLDMSDVAVVRGRLVNCDDSATAGMVRVSWDGIIQNAFFTSDGMFTVSVPAGKQVTIATIGAGSTVPALTGCAVHNIGDLQMCGAGSTEQTIDWTVAEQGGASWVFQSGTGSGMQPGGVVLDTSNNLLLYGRGDSVYSELRLHGRGITSTGSYAIGTLATDPAAGVLMSTGYGQNIRLSTDRDSSSMGIDTLPVTAGGTLTITRMTSTEVEGSFTFTTATIRWIPITVSGSFIGRRE